METSDERDERYDCFVYSPFTLARAVGILADRMNTRVRLSDPEPLWDRPDNCKKNVLRCRLDAETADAPSYIILKHIANPKCLYDPTDMVPYSLAWRLSGEWAGCQFVSQLGADPSLSPHCYGGDFRECMVVLEDIGHGPRVEDYLCGNDPVAAENALVAYARALGKMHALSIGRESEYNRLLQALAPRSTTIRAFDGAQIRGHLQRIESLLQVLPLSLSPGFLEEVESVLETLLEPGPFLAFTHGDPNPVNDMVVGQGVRLYDFEYSGFRHAFMDGVFNRHLYPWVRFRLPGSILIRIEAIYRAELAKGCPAAREDSLYHKAVMVGRAGWLLSSLRGCLETCMEADGYGYRAEELSEEEQATAPTQRQRALLLLEGFVEAAETIRQLPGMRTMASEIAARLRLEWQVSPYRLPLYPAFR